VSEKAARKSPPDGREQDRLREMLRAHTEAVQTQAIQSKGEVSAEQLESLQRLSRLVEISDATRPKASRDRLSLIIIFAVTFLILSILLFGHRDSAEIELNAEVDQLSFVIPKQQLFSDSVAVSALGASGLKQIQLPRARGEDAQTLAAPQSAGLDIMLAAIKDDPAPGEITFPDLVVPVRTRVWLQKTMLPLRYRLTLEGTGLNLQANVNGAVQVSVAGSAPRRLTFLSPKPIVFQAETMPVNFDLTLTSLPHTISAMPIAVEDLSLLRIEDRNGPGSEPVRVTSTILAGTIFFDELNGEELKLRPRQMIRLGQSEGEVQFLQIKDDRIAVQFHGRVHGLQTGSEATAKTLMPTWLEWLKARRALYLFWGTGIYFFGLIAGFLRWWKGSS
jgi:hypothetical protein